MDGFKAINDKFSHESGDIVLKIIADRLLNCIRSCDIVSRLGGDEFTIILENIEDIFEIKEVCTRITEIIAGDVILDDHKVNATASIDISVFPNDGDNMHDLLRKADDAMYGAKRSGKNKFLFYDASMAGAKV